MKESKAEKHYREKYGDIEEGTDYLQIIKDNYNLDFELINSEIERISSIPWKEVDLILYLIPKPTPRAKKGKNHFYVKNAATNKRLMNDIITYTDIIYTRTEFILDTYIPTPISAMNKHEVYLAEAKHIRPLGNADFDNLAKTYSDMLQDVLLINDNIISSGHIEKYWSIKPRIELKIRYQNAFDSKYNQRRMEKTKAYQKFFLKEEIIG